MTTIHRKEELIPKKIYHAVMVTVVSLLTVHIVIHPGGVLVKKVHNAMISIVQLIIHQTARLNASTIVNVEIRNLVVLIYTRTQTKLSLHPIDQRHTTTREHIRTGNNHIFNPMKSILLK
jgi:hypothetical protein